MKLSEAIILGSISTTQAFSEDSKDGLCVIKTALHAVGKHTNINIYGRLWETWPWTDQTKAINPVDGWEDRVTRILYHLNDIHHWPRPKIAEWVKTIEPSEVPTPSIQETPLVEATR